MSTDPQLLGDSRRRQLEASKAYAKEHGLELAVLPKSIKYIYAAHAAI